jgi:hypothetical protein
VRVFSFFCQTPLNLQSRNIAELHPAVHASLFEDGYLHMPSCYFELPPANPRPLIMGEMLVVPIDHSEWRSAARPPVAVDGAIAVKAHFMADGVHVLPESHDRLLLMAVVRHADRQRLYKASASLPSMSTPPRPEAAWLVHAGVSGYVLHRLDNEQLHSVVAVSCHCFSHKLATYINEHCRSMGPVWQLPVSVAYAGDGAQSNHVTVMTGSGGSADSVVRSVMLRDEGDAVARKS